MDEGRPVEPFVVTNWKAALGGQSLRGAREFGLYSDGYIVASLPDAGPYSILNTVPGIAVRGVARKAGVLRVALHGDWDRVELGEAPRTDVAIYHGGGLDDEVAALLSLVPGARVQSGGVERLFIAGGDPMGQPLAIAEMMGKGQPVMMAGREAILPFSTQRKDFRDAGLLRHLLRLTPNQAVALIRAARAYQLAIWIAEAQPELSWLFLVAAVEHGAQEWMVAEEGPEAIFALAEPDLANSIEARAGRDIFLEIAAELAPLMASTRKFIRFCQAFMPGPPPARPPVGFQFEWSTERLERLLRLVYRYRSGALHKGIPFPSPMCFPPHRGGEDWAAPSEVTLGLAAAVPGGQWRHDDIPVHLHVFEHIAREALLNWWKSLAETPVETFEEPANP